MLKTLWMGTWQSATSSP